MESLGWKLPHPHWIDQTADLYCPTSPVVVVVIVVVVVCSSVVRSIAHMNTPSIEHCDVTIYG